MSKWTLNRVFAFVLAVMMILTVPEVSAAAAVDANVEEAVVESTETNDVVEGVFDIESVQIEADDKEAANTANTTIIYEEIVDLGEIQTSAGGTTFFGADDYVPKTSGNHAEWIDRIEVSNDGKAFYNSLVEAVDNDGTADFLIEDDYYSANNTMNNIHVFNYSDGSSETCNVVEYTKITITDYSTFDMEPYYAEMRAVYDAFDRDFPEVFWMSGSTSAAASIGFDGTNYEITFYMILKSHKDGFDIRATNYQTESAIKTGITARDNAVNTILTGTSATNTDTVELIKYFNTWLTKNNEYCTASTYPDSSYECLSALQGSTGTIGPVCEAYARAFKVLCDTKNIPCVLVDGYATSDSNPGEAHMWNYVQVGTNWYAVDVTWNDPVGGNSGAVSGGENEGWLLLGSNTVVTSTGMTFIQTHPVSNQASYNGVCFTNGPELSEKSYEVSDIKSATIDNWETTYGYGADSTPTVNITLEDGATGKITYQWFEAVWNTEDETASWSPISGATTNKLPTGLDSNYYYVQVYYNGEKVLYSDVYVYMKELTPTITGTTSKTYDGSTTYVGNDLSISLDGVVNGDVITATANYAYTDANAGENITITATDIQIDGEKVYNYKLASTTATADVGTISPADISNATVTLDKTALTYNGSEQTVTPTVKLNDSKTLIAGTDYTVSGNTAKDVKDSPYTVTVTGKGNYTGTAKATYTMSYLNANITILYNEQDMAPAWMKESMTISAEGYTVSDALDGTYAPTYVVDQEGRTENLKLYFKNEEGYITDAKDISSFGIDKTAPSFEAEGMGIKVSTNYWKVLLDTITFKLFNIDTKDITIAAQDEHSGVLEYRYYVDESGSTTVKTSEELDELAAEFKNLSPNGKFSLDEEGKYVIYAYAMDNAGNKSGYICTDGIVIDTTAPTIEAKVPNADDGSLQDTKATIKFTASEAGYYYVICGENASVRYTAEEVAKRAGSHNMVKGENDITLWPFDPNSYHIAYIAVKDLAGNLSSTVTTVEFTTQKTLPNITTVPTINGTYGDTVGAMNINGGVASVDGTAITGTWSVTTDTTDIPEVGTTKEYTVKFTPAETDKYGEVTVNVVPTVAKKDITVTVNDAEKVFGKENPTFDFKVEDGALVGDDTKADLGITLSTTATMTSDVGGYDITGTANAKNYNVTIEAGTLTITKATANNPAAITKEYVYGLGSEGNVYMPLTDLLPTDHGGVIYKATKVDNNSIIDKLACGENEVLYSVKAGNLNDTATITVTATSKNYEDITITINITLVDKLSVSLKSGSTVTTVGSLTYGDALSKLTFGSVTFVDTEGNEVAGTVSWDAPTTKLDAGTHEVAWTFTPSNTGKYKTATGTVSVTVAKATPNVAVPTTAGITYNPSQTLKDIAIVSGTTDVAGTWSWKDGTIVPTVGNTGYVAVFIPNNTDNYNTVEKTVTVEVAKATPVVSVAPTAADIVYLNTLADSILSGGKVVYTTDSDVTVNGTWAWKDATIAPVVADSGKTEYDIVFTPADTTNYNTVTTKITLVVAKATIPANAPAAEMKVEEEIVSDIVLPEGWAWAEEDAEKDVERGSEVTAKAIYTAEDVVNYETTEVEIKITLIEPQIYGEDGKAGWDVIEDEIENTQDDEVKVDMNGTTKVDRQTLETLKEKDKTMVVVFTDEDGKEEYTWEIKGSDVKDGDFKNVKMDVVMTDDNEAEIPEALVKEAIANANDHKFLSLSHDGEFGFKATLTINVGKENAGKLATLYYYNEETGKLLETENIKVEVDANGNISLVFEHASDYVISINDKITSPLPGGDDTNPTPGPTAPDTGDGLFGNVYFYITLLLAGGLAGYVGVRKKREE